MILRITKRGRGGVLGHGLQFANARTMKRSIIGVLAAIAITTAMDAARLSTFSALPLIPLMGLFWYWERFSRKEMGFTWGRRRDYGLAVLHPLVVLGAAVLVAGLAGAIDVSDTDWGKAGLNMVVISLSTIIAAIITEEGFFRGWLVASLKRAGSSQAKIVLWSSLAFSLWHLSAVSIDTDIGFALPAARIPVFMVNAFAIGAIWGILRLISGSVIVASVGHGLWNGINYGLFAFGEKVGALGVEETAIFGPEVGVVGLALNMVYAAVLWRWWIVRSRSYP